MAGFRIEGNSSGNVAEVDANNLVRVTGANAGAFSDVSAGKFMVVDADGNPIEFDNEGAVKTSPMQPVFHDPIDGAGVVPDFRLWSWAGTTMTVVQNATPSRYTLNNGAITTINTNMVLTTINLFIPMRIGVVNFYSKVKPTALPNTNSQAEIGFMNVSGAATPTDGAYFRWKSNNTFVCVTSRGGVETESAVQTAPTAGEYSVMEIYWTAEKAVFEWAVSGVQNSLTMSVGVAVPNLIDSARVPIAARVMIGGIAPGSAPLLEIGEVVVFQNTIEFNEPVMTTHVAQLGNGAVQSPVSAYAQTANFANSTAPSTILAASLSNTTAAYTTLGGKFAFIAPSPVATDFILFGFQVPAGRKLCITGVSINHVNTVAAQGATTPLVLDWGLAVNSSAVSLATADTVPNTGVGFAIAPRRIALGLQAYAVAAAIGATATPAEIVRTFLDAPVVCEPNRWVHIIVACPVGPTTGTAVTRGSVMFSGYFR